MVKNTISMNVSAIGTDDGKSTFEVRRTWNERGKKAIVIGMYPTISTEKCEMLDVSNMHLLNHANDLGWGELRMMNLYATVIKGKPCVGQLQDNSLAYIEEVLDGKDINTYDIVIAWGNSLMTHKNTIKAKIDLLAMLLEKGLSAKCITVDSLATKISFGVHPLYLGLHYPREIWKLANFPVKETLVELEKSIKNDKPVEKKKMKKMKLTKKSDDGKDGE